MEENWIHHVGPGPTLIKHPIRANSARKLRQLRKYARRCTILSFWYCGVKPDIWPDARRTLINPHGECKVANVQLEWTNRKTQ